MKIKQWLAVCWVIVFVASRPWVVQAQSPAAFKLTPMVSTGVPVTASVNFAQFNTVAINAHGQVAFIAGEYTGLYLQTGDGITPVASTAEPVPGLSGVYFDELLGLSLNNRGEIAFIATTFGARSLKGIFLYSPSTEMIRSVVLSSERPPVPTFSSYQDFLHVFLNDSGQVAFTGSLTATQTAAFLWTEGRVQAIAAPTQPAPAVGGQFTAVSVRSFTNSGKLLLQASVRNGSASSAVFLYSGGAFQLLLATGQAAPVGGTFQRFSQTVLISEAGDVAFVGFATNGNTASVNLYAMIGGKLETIAVGGQSVTLLVGEKYLDFPTIASNQQQEFAFRAVFESGRQGLFVYSQRNLSVAVYSQKTVVGGVADRFVPTGDIAINAGRTIGFIGYTVNPGTVGIYLVNGLNVTPAVTSRMAVPGARHLLLGSDLAFSPNGTLAFSGLVTGNGRGLHLSDNGTIRPLLVPGQSVANSSNGIVSEIPDFDSNRFVLSDQGGTAMSVSLLGGIADVGVIRVLMRGPEAVALVNRDAQGLPNTLFISFEDVVMNQSGMVVFNGMIRQGSGEDTTEKEVIIRYANGQHQLVAIESQLAPGDARFVSFNSKDLWINNEGDIVFIASLDDGDEGVFLWAGGRFILVAKGQRQAPGLDGRRYGQFESVMVNDRGEVVFQTYDDDGQALFHWANGRASLVAYTGMGVPGDAGQVFQAIGQPVINNAGQIAFLGTWLTIRQGVFMFDKGVLMPVATTLQSLPGGTGRLSRFYNLGLNRHGHIAFTVATNGSSLPSAIYVATPANQ